jgi:hypothetical protein
MGEVWELGSDDSEPWEIEPEPPGAQVADDELRLKARTEKLWPDPVPEDANDSDEPWDCHLEAPPQPDGVEPRWWSNSDD